MTKILCFLCLVVFNCSAYAQNFREFKVGEIPDSLRTNSDRLIQFIRDVQANTVADIGSGDLRLILKIANHYHDKTFVFEDIDSSVCNKEAMHKVVMEENLQNIDTNNVSIWIGGMKSTHLPSNHFDLVLVLSTIHDMEYTDDMFEDIRRILKPRGTLILQCPVTEVQSETHKDIGCINRVMTHAEFNKLIINKQLKILKDWRFQFGSDMSYVKRIVMCKYYPN